MAVMIEVATTCSIVTTSDAAAATAGQNHKLALSASPLPPLLALTARFSTHSFHGQPPATRR
jgi:hypothetical protein